MTSRLISPSGFDAPFLERRSFVAPPLLRFFFFFSFPVYSNAIHVEFSYEEHVRNEKHFHDDIAAQLESTVISQAE